MQGTELHNTLHEMKAKIGSSSYYRLKVRSIERLNETLNRLLSPPPSNNSPPPHLEVGMMYYVG